MTRPPFPLGPDSPLHELARTPARRRREDREFPIHRELVALLVGDARQGMQFVPGAGMTGRWPELLLLTAIPNGTSVSGKAAAGRRKAEGANKGACDLMLPVARGPFFGLGIEVKDPKEGRVTPEQARYHARLRAEGWLVVVIDSVQAGLDVVTGYLRLRPPVLPPSVLDERVALAAQLTPPLARAGGNDTARHLDGAR